VARILPICALVTDDEVGDLLPNRAQARKLVVNVAIFWAAIMMAVLVGPVAPALGVAGVAIGLVFGARFYLTLYGVWTPLSGESPWRMMLVPSFSRRRLQAQLHIFDLVRPRWIMHTLRETGWNPTIVGCGLLGMLVVDAVLVVVVLPHTAGSASCSHAAVCR
jgi:hypothetical protein